jgi:hypothetical protein
MLGVLGLEQCAQLRCEREHAAIAVLRCPDLEAHLAGGEIHLVPFERQDFTRDAPTGYVGKSNDRPQHWWQMCADRGDLVRLEEPRADVVLVRQLNVWLCQKLSRLDCESERPFQGRQLAIDLPIRRAGGLTLRHKRPDIRRRDRRHLAAPEERRQVFANAALEDRQRPLAVDLVVGDDVRDGLLESEPPNLRRDRHAARAVAARSFRSAIATLFLEPHAPTARHPHNW